MTQSLFGAAVERVDRVVGVVGAVFAGSTLSGLGGIAIWCRGFELGAAKFYEVLLWAEGVFENGYNGSTVETGQAGEDWQNKRWDPTVVEVLVCGEIYRWALTLPVTRNKGSRHGGHE
ncbi:hypothetical protein N7478_010479 [Penicillium angulare]|uniref:uncharacterized protein n=1 Tax=Penicillium angulare TaxID=116970 RepID=UPI00253F68FC|nr:uncharacterized protein N7478_010298 [Penicillium angulare]XP_056776063.1 uncharacterized protein N7478_010479 [Penicillium angulare]KAJ5267490.1 hypothetical protein N7478_010298 [Penicillium angulare]KAJ5267671.1 hypothetical protein N7478_010479 [Penicillium angulare]